MKWRPEFKKFLKDGDLLTLNRGIVYTVNTTNNAIEIGGENFDLEHYTTRVYEWIKAVNNKSISEWITFVELQENPQLEFKFQGDK